MISAPILYRAIEKHLLMLEHLHGDKNCCKEGSISRDFHSPSISHRHTPTTMRKCVDGKELQVRETGIGVVCVRDFKYLIIFILTRSSAQHPKILQLKGLNERVPSLENAKTKLKCLALDHLILKV